MTFQKVLVQMQTQARNEEQLLLSALHPKCIGEQARAMRRDINALRTACRMIRTIHGALYTLRR